MLICKSRQLSVLVIGATLLGGGPSAAQQVFNSDVVIKGSLCTGFDCPNAPSFGFDTIILRENNLRIFFDDTSVASGFPANKWRITINDSVNGGVNFFSIDDATAARQIFRLDAGARANSIFVSNTGRVGFGTTTPVLITHSRSGDTPGHRLEQDGSVGYSPQTWDIAGNEANFFIRDVTGGSRLPFRIRPGAPTSSIDISAVGRVGIGTASPTAPIHVEVKGTTIGTGNVGALIKNADGPSAVQLFPVSATNTVFWNLTALDGNLFRINSSTGGPVKFELTSTGNLTIPGTLTTGGPTCGGGCDRVFDAKSSLPSIDEHARQMWTNGHLPNVGPTPEGKPIDVTDKLGRMLNELEKAHIYIEQLHRRLEALEQATKAKKG